MSISATGKANLMRRELLAALQPKYVWWQLEGSEDERATRVLAQVMNLGTYEDIRAVEKLFDRDELADILRFAQPGWFSPRSWGFWRGRLSLSSDETIPAKPPGRSFDAEVLQTGT